MEKKEYARIIALGEIVQKLRYWETDPIEKQLIENIVQEVQNLIFYEDTKESL